MSEEIFNNVFDIIILIFTFSIGVGWIILIIYMLLQKLFPSIEDKLEIQLQFIGKILNPLTVTAFIILLGYIFIRFVFELTSQL